MEKIIIAVICNQTNRPTIDLASYLAKLAQSRIKGLFIQDIHIELISDHHFHESYFKEVNEKDTGSETSIKKDVEQSIRMFKEACERREVNCEAYEVKGDPIEEVVHESRFADVLVLNPNTTFSKLAEGVPTHFVREVMEHAECPIVIAPETFDGIDDIHFCYDGSRSSMFAMKQFTYLFPQYQTRKVSLLEIKNSATEVTKDESKVLFWLKRHYHKVDHHVLSGDKIKGFLSYFLQRKNAFIVMGAYGRSALSYFFKKSSADLLLRVIDLPLFIAHG